MTNGLYGVVHIGYRAAGRTATNATLLGKLIIEPQFPSSGPGRQDPSRKFCSIDHARHSAWDTAKEEDAARSIVQVRQGGL